MPRDRHARLHATGEHVRVTVRKAGEIHFFYVVHSLFCCSLSRQFSARRQRKHDVLLDCLPGQRLVKLLKHHHAIRSGFGDCPVIEADLPLGGSEIAPRCLEQGGFAATRRTEQYKAIRPIYVEVDAVSRGDQMVFGLVLQGDSLDFQKRRAFFHTSPPAGLPDVECNDFQPLSTPPPRALYRSAAN